MSKKHKKEEVTVEDIPAADTGVEEEEQISKVREILFGSKSRQLETSLGHLEERMRMEHSSIRREFHERFDSLESFIKGEVQGLLDRLDREETSRKDSLKSLRTKLQDMGDELGDKNVDLNKRLDDSERTLRDQILQARERLTDDIKDRTQELTDQLQSEAKELRKGKTDRTTMAALLTDMASRLNEDEV